MIITVVAIAKNEARNILRWLENVKEADHVVVLADPYSTDDTTQMLIDGGCDVTVKEIKPWRWDVARNEALKLVPEDTDVIVSSDIDETFDRGWADVLRNHFDIEHYNRVRCWFQLSMGKDAQTYRRHIVKNDGTWYWKYPVHEQLCRTDQNEIEQDLTDYLTVRHWHDPDVNPRDYKPLFQLRIDEDEHDDMAYIYMASAHLEDKNYQKAIDCVKNVIIHNNSKPLVSYAYSLIGYAQSFINLDSKYCYLKGIETDKTYVHNYVLLATSGYDDIPQLLKCAKRDTYIHYDLLDGKGATHTLFDNLCRIYLRD